MAKSPIPATAALQSRRSLRTQYDALIAIPCSNEAETLPETLHSIATNAPETYDKTLIIVNVNQRATLDRQQNRATLEWLHAFETPLHLGWLDHVNEDAAYPEKFGVGLARHQACMSGLPFLRDSAPVISLDADSPVNAAYLPAIFAHLQQHPDFKAGHVNFKHRNCGSDAEAKAIRVYEQHLKRHRQRLADADSPHAWYAIGSTIVCTKEAYLKSGGYHPRRMAGEDFYLLQQLSKVGCTIHMIEDAFVYPSDRISDRVPFGTGKAVGEIVTHGIWPTYHDHCYRDLGKLLTTIGGNLDKPVEVVLGAVPKTCSDWLSERNFHDVWPKLQANASDAAGLLRRFHEWLDAFQTLKLIHYLSDHHYPRQEMSSDDAQKK